MKDDSNEAVLGELVTAVGAFARKVETRAPGRFVALVLNDPEGWERLAVAFNAAAEKVETQARFVGAAEVLERGAALVPAPLLVEVFLAASPSTVEKMAADLRTADVMRELFDPSWGSEEEGPVGRALLKDAGPERCRALTAALFDEAPAIERAEPDPAASLSVVDGLPVPAVCPMCKSPAIATAGVWSCSEKTGPCRLG